jgi:hypothetical protein
MNGARSCWRMMAGLARSSMLHDSRWRKWWGKLKQKSRRAKTKQKSPILLYDVRKWISWRGIEKLVNVHKMLFLRTNEIVYLIFILTLKLTKIASFEVIIGDGYVDCRFIGCDVVWSGTGLLMFWANVLLNFPTRNMWAVCYCKVSVSISLHGATYREISPKNNRL